MKRLLGLTMLLLIFALSAPVMAAKDDKGHGAGGVRADKASEMGLEKGKAWAGSKEKEEKEGSEEDASGDEDKVKKEKKEKKEKKDD